MIVSSNNTTSFRLDRIMVTAPYNILTNIKDELDYVSANVKNDFLHEKEHGPIGTAEAGRHIAILGSLALSKNTSSKNCYLAIDVIITRETTSITDTDLLEVRAKVIESNKRKGVIDGAIITNGMVLYKARVEYKVLSEPLFEKFFGNFNVQIKNKKDVSPYVKRKSLTKLEFAKNSVSAIYGTVFPEDCEGHFNGYPALPVGILGSSFIELAIELAFQANPSMKQAIITKADIKAVRLAFAGEFITLKAKIKQQYAEDRFLGYCEAYVESDLIAKVEYEILCI